MIDYDADLVEEELDRRLNMEFDWKRRPYAIGTSLVYHGHIIFDTVPWQSVENFQSVREQWTEYQKKNPICIKSPDDYERFALYADSVLSLSEQDRKYLPSNDPDLARLRQTLCRAWHRNALGLTQDITVEYDNRIRKVDFAEAFAKIMSQCGIETSRFDVENAKRKNRLAMNACPRTKRCIDAVNKIKQFYPKLDSEGIFTKASAPQLLLTTSSASESLFVSKAANLCRSSERT